MVESSLVKLDIRKHLISSVGMKYGSWYKSVSLLEPFTISQMYLSKYYKLHPHCTAATPVKCDRDIQFTNNDMVISIYCEDGRSWLSLQWRHNGRDSVSNY